MSLKLTVEIDFETDLYSVKINKIDSLSITTILKESMTKEKLKQLLEDFKKVEEHFKL